MANFLKNLGGKVKSVFNPDGFDDNYTDDYFGENEGDYEQGDYDDQNYDDSAAYRTNVGGGVSLNGSALELKVIRPERFDSVSQIADHLLNKRTVVLNLEATNKETSRRIIDFLSGVAYSIGGNLKRVANNTFVITPCNVDVTNDGQEAPKGNDKPNTSDLYDNL